MGGHGFQKIGAVILALVAKKRACPKNSVKSLVLEFDYTLGGGGSEWPQANEPAAQSVIKFKSQAFYGALESEFFFQGEGEFFCKTGGHPSHPIRHMACRRISVKKLWPIWQRE